MTTKSASKTSEFKEGDRVVYHPVGGAAATSVGVIKKVLTHVEEVGARHATMHASQEEPRYLIENEHTHKETAYKLDHIVEKTEK